VHQFAPNLRGDPDDGGEIQAAQASVPSLRGDPDDGGEIQKAAQASVPSLRGDPDDGGQIHTAAHAIAGEHDVMAATWIDHAAVMSHDFFIV
jgi:hypothetical protein